MFFFIFLIFFSYSLSLCSQLVDVVALTDEDESLTPLQRSAMMRRLLVVCVAAAVSLTITVLGSSSRVCPLQCRCLDHDSIVNCHNADVDRLPSPLPSAAIVVDADRNRISALYYQFPSSLLFFYFFFIIIIIFFFFFIVIVIAVILF